MKKFFTFLILGLMVFAGGSAHATTTVLPNDYSSSTYKDASGNTGLDPFRLETDTLKGGIANKNSNEPTDVSGAMNVLGKFSGTLRLGSTGNNVKALQSILIKEGLLKGLADGKFGNGTLGALKNYQTQHGLKPDGIAGPTTIKLIIKDSTNNTNNTNTDKGNSTKNTNTNTNTNSNNNSSNTNTISLTKKKNKNTLLKNYACKEETKDRMYVFLGEVIDEAKNSIYRMADVWSTADGVNWRQDATNIATGEKWEPMVVNTGKTVFVFGGKYKKDASTHDNSVYKTTNMKDWSYVGELPDLSRYYDKSVVYFKNKFWLIASEEGAKGVWSSADGATWSQEFAQTPWDGAGRHRVANSKGSYDSNSLGAFVLGGKIWYLVFDGQATTTNPQVSMFSSSDGKNWKDEGLLSENISNYSNGASLKIGTNTNPAPVVHNGKVWIMTTMFGSNTPIVLNSANGKTWNLVLGSEDRSNVVGGVLSTDFPIGYYSSDVSFDGKLWKIGGWNYTNGNDNAIYSSKDGETWQKVDAKGISFPGPADRHLAGATVLKSMKSKPTDLKIGREYNATSFFTGSDQVETTLGKWQLTAGSEKNPANKNKIEITSVSFVGNNYKPSSGKDFSTLENLSNIAVYIDGVKVGSVAKFSGPYYDTSSRAIGQIVKFDSPYVLNNDDSVWMELKADFPAPKWKNFEMRTFLNGITFKDSYTTPCLVYSDDLSSGYEMVPGRNIYWSTN